MLAVLRKRENKEGSQSRVRMETLAKSQDTQSTLNTKHRYWLLNYLDDLAFTRLSLHYPSINQDTRH